MSPDESLVEEAGCGAYKLPIMIVLCPYFNLYCCTMLSSVPSHCSSAGVTVQSAGTMCPQYICTQPS